MRHNGELAILLERAGLGVRGRRADCIHCQGRSRLTVSFTDEVAFCHRCKWTRNERQLRRELGLLPTDPESRRRDAAQERERRRRVRIAAEFEKWRSARLREVTTEYRALGRRAAIAKIALGYYPDWELAWSHLAAFYDAEAKLMQQIDYLSGTKASQWLQTDSKLQGLFEAWQRRAA